MCVGKIRFVSKEEHRQCLVADVGVIKQLFKLILSDSEPQFIGSIDNEDDCFTLSVVVLPKGSVLALARHVECCEVDLVLMEGLNLETNGGSQLLLLVLLWFKEVDHRGFARVVQSHYDDLRLF